MCMRNKNQQTIIKPHFQNWKILFYSKPSNEFDIVILSLTSDYGSIKFIKFSDVLATTKVLMNVYLIMVMVS